ncbi:O-antigen ligase domain-containing protein [Cryomorphaceae bacterium]|nr:O-antigen ligase domain-containing protein [Cryomorphaceae bacterium]
MSRTISTSVGILFGLVVWGLLIMKNGMMGILMIGMLPFIILAVAGFFRYPKIGLYGVLIFSFFVGFLNRLIPGVPFGLMVDAILVLTGIGIIFFFWQKAPTKYWKSPVVWGFVGWMAMIILQLANPIASSRVAWFYAMRGMALYPVLTILLGMLVLRSPKDISRFLFIWMTLSFLGALYGVKQQLFGVFGFEQRWLDAGAAVQHVLFGKLRIFSFYSDAGQFGPAMAQASLVAGLLFLSSHRRKIRWIMLVVALAAFYGMLISGTRGALAVPFFGGILYLILIKNFRILALGIVVGFSAFAFLKYTTIANSNYEINRLRTALDPNNPSLLVRLNNQARLKVYLRDKPFGGGVGSAGSWGERFAPGTFLAEFPTDSLYVAIRAETGVVGLNLFFLFIFGPAIYAFVRIYRMPESPRRPVLVALLSGYVGILGASYGNSVLTQMPTSFVCYFSLLAIFTSIQRYDREEEIAQRKIAVDVDDPED